MEAKHLINFCWFWFKWGLVASVVGAALCVPYFYNRIDDEIRRTVEQRIAQQYPGLQVKIRSAMLHKGEGIDVRGLSIIDPAAEGPGAELLSYDECVVNCRTDLADILSGDLAATRVTLRRPTLRMTRRPDGTWSASRLLPLPKFGPGPPPELRIENGTLEVFDPLKTISCTMTLRDVNLTLTPVATVPGQRESTRRRVQGTASGDHFRQIFFEGEVDPDQRNLILSGKVQGMEVSPELRNVLPSSCGGDLSMLGSLRGQTEASFHVSYDPAAAAPWQFDINGGLVRGRIDDARLPHPLTEIHALVHVNNQGFNVDELTARCNQAVLKMSCTGGLSPSSPMIVKADIRQLELDTPLLAILPVKLQEEWQKFRPEGQIDADIELRYDGRSWQPEATLHCLNVSFSHYKFPYRLEHGKGVLRLKDDRLTLNLTAYSDNRPVRIDGEANNPRAGCAGWVRVQGDEMPIDEKLLIAMPPRPQSLARSFDLRGMIGFQYEMSRDVPGGPEHKHLVVQASRCWIRYDRFPYAISNVRGTMEMIDDHWWFRNIEGNNGTSRVTGEGTLGPTPKGNELVLQFQAGDVPLAGELRDSLQPAMRQVWGVLQPRGTIDLTSSVHYLDQSNHLDVTVRAEPRGDTCSIEPVNFRYPLEKLQGVFSYANGQLTFERLRAEHGPVTMACNGTCGFQADGGWQLHLDRLVVDRMRMDRQLLQALPPQLKKSLGELNPSGPMSLRGSLLLARGGNLQDPVSSKWNLAVGLNQVNIDCGMRLENIYGNITLAGAFDGHTFQTRGELALDSLTYQDHQFTQILGPLWIDEREALFGSWVAQRENRQLTKGQPQTPLRPLSAKIFGGSVYGDGWVAFGQQPRYGAQARMVDADLAACARELASGNRNLHGRLLGNVEVHGVGRSRNALAGHGSLYLRDANVYELPAMISMLKILSVRAPDPNAFSKSDIDFRIEGEHFYFDKLDFNGDAISLLGKGEMNFQGDTRCTFTAVVGRGDGGMPILRNIFKDASQQFMLIHVGGNVQNPDIRQEAFPGVNQALKNLQ